MTVFTSRPDTVFGVQYLVVAPEHSLIDAKYVKSLTVVMYNGRRFSVPIFDALNRYLPLEYVQQVTTFVDDLKKSQNYSDLDKNKEGKEPRSFPDLKSLSSTISNFK